MWETISLQGHQKMLVIGEQYRFTYISQLIRSENIHLQECIVSHKTSGNWLFLFSEKNIFKEKQGKLL